MKKLDWVVGVFICLVASTQVVRAKDNQKEEIFQTQETELYTEDLLLSEEYKEAVVIDSHSQSSDEGLMIRFSLIERINFNSDGRRTSSKRIVRLQFGRYLLWCDPVEDTECTKTRVVDLCLSMIGAESEGCKEISLQLDEFDDFIKFVQNLNNLTKNPSLKKTLAGGSWKGLKSVTFSSRLENIKGFDGKEKKEKQWVSRIALSQWKFSLPITLENFLKTLQSVRRGPITEQPAEEPETEPDDEE